MASTEESASARTWRYAARRFGQEAGPDRLTARDVHLALVEVAHLRPRKGPPDAFLMEQQWKTDFWMALAAEQPLRASVASNGAVRPRSDWEAPVTSPVAGRLVTAGASFPRVGMDVKRDQLLAVLAPRLGTDADPATLELAVTRARLAFELAQRERVRAEGLFAQQAVAERRVIEARSAEALAVEEHSAATRRLARFQGGFTGQARKALAIPASAVVDDGKQEVAYVLSSGGAFKRRPLKLGVRDGDLVEVVEGLMPAERVVSRGAWQMRLAAAGGALPAHGHVHQRDPMIDSVIRWSLQNRLFVILGAGILLRWVPIRRCALRSKEELLAALRSDLSRIPGMAITIGQPISWWTCRSSAVGHSHPDRPVSSRARSRSRARSCPGAALAHPHDRARHQARPGSTGPLR